MRFPIPLPAALAVVATLLPLLSCASTPDKGGSGEVNVTLRRIDVLEADYDAMKLAIVLGVENGTSGDVSIAAEASLAVVGEAKATDDSDAEGAAPDAAPEESPVVDSTEVKTDGSADRPIDGKRHPGKGSGSAPAYNTSELPIVIELPLPEDPALLESMLGWKKMAVHIEGTVQVGLKTIRIGGLRELAPPHLPEVRLKEAQVASENGGQSGAGFFTVLLDNKNPFPVTVDKLDFTITIKDKQLEPANGNNSVADDEVPGSAVAEYQVEVLINEAAFGKDLKALLKQPTVPYVIEGKVNVRGIERPFKFAGDMKFAR